SPLSVGSVDCGRPRARIHLLHRGGGARADEDRRRAGEGNSAERPAPPDTATGGSSEPADPSGTAPGPAEPPFDPAGETSLAHRGAIRSPAVRRPPRRSPMKSPQAAARQAPIRPAGATP